MVILTKTRFGRADAGCYLDGHMGWHNQYRVVDLAHRAGMTLVPEDCELLDRAREDYWESTPEEWEALHEMADEATEYLQGKTDDGLVWWWDMGELCLTECDDSDEYGPIMLG